MLNLELLEYSPVFVWDSKGRRKKGHPCAYKSRGIYCIRENGKLVYVGMSLTCIVKACYRHFYKWNDFRQGVDIRRVTYAEYINDRNYEIAVWLVETEKHTRQLERILIKKTVPRDNLQYLEKEEYKEQRLMDYEDTGIEYPRDYVPF